MDLLGNGTVEGVSKVLYSTLLARITKLVRRSHWHGNEHEHREANKIMQGPRETLQQKQTCAALRTRTCPLWTDSAMALLQGLASIQSVLHVDVWSLRDPLHY